MASFNIPSIALPSKSGPAIEVETIATVESKLKPELKPVLDESLRVAKGLHEIEPKNVFQDRVDSLKEYEGHPDYTINNATLGTVKITNSITNEAIEIEYSVKGKMAGKALNVEDLNEKNVTKITRQVTNKSGNIIQVATEVSEKENYSTTNLTQNPVTNESTVTSAAKGKDNKIVFSFEHQAKDKKDKTSGKDFTGKKTSFSSVYTPIKDASGKTEVKADIRVSTVDAYDKTTTPPAVKPITSFYGKITDLELNKEVDPDNDPDDAEELKARLEAIKLEIPEEKPSVDIDKLADDVASADQATKDQAVAELKKLGLKDEDLQNKTKEEIKQKALGAVVAKAREINKKLEEDRSLTADQRDELQKEADKYKTTIKREMKGPEEVKSLAERLQQLKTEFDAENADPDKKQSLKEQIEALEAEISEKRVKAVDALLKGAGTPEQVINEVQGKVKDAEQPSGWLAAFKTVWEKKGGFWGFIKAVTPAILGSVALKYGVIGAAAATGAPALLIMGGVLATMGVVSLYQAIRDGNAMAKEAGFKNVLELMMKGGIGSSAALGLFLLKVGGRFIPGIGGPLTMVLGTAAEIGTAVYSEKRRMDTREKCANLFQKEAQARQYGERKLANAGFIVYEKGTDVDPVQANRKGISVDALLNAALSTDTSPISIQNKKIALQTLTGAFSKEFADAKNPTENELKNVLTGIKNGMTTGDKATQEKFVKQILDAYIAVEVHDIEQAIAAEQSKLYETVKHLMAFNLSSRLLNAGYSVAVGGTMLVSEGVQIYSNYKLEEEIREKVYDNDAKVRIVNSGENKIIAVDVDNNGKVDLVANATDPESMQALTPEGVKQLAVIESEGALDYDDLTVRSINSSNDLTQVEDLMEWKNQEDAYAENITNLGQRPDVARQNEVLYSSPVEQPNLEDRGFTGYILDDKNRIVGSVLSNDNGTFDYISNKQLEDILLVNGESINIDRVELAYGNVPGVQHLYAVYTNTEGTEVKVDLTELGSANQNVASAVANPIPTQTPNPSYAPTTISTPNMYVDAEGDLHIVAEPNDSMNRLGQKVGDALGATENAGERTIAYQFDKQIRQDNGFNTLKVGADVEIDNEILQKIEGVDLSKLDQLPRELGGTGPGIGNPGAGNPGAGNPGGLLPQGPTIVTDDGTSVTLTNMPTTTTTITDITDLNDQFNVNVVGFDDYAALGVAGVAGLAGGIAGFVTRKDNGPSIEATAGIVENGKVTWNNTTSEVNAPASNTANIKGSAEAKNGSSNEANPTGNNPETDPNKELKEKAKQPIKVYISADGEIITNQQWLNQAENERVKFTAMEINPPESFTWPHLPEKALAENSRSMEGWIAEQQIAWKEVVEYLVKNQQIFIEADQKAVWQNAYRGYLQNVTTSLSPSEIAAKQRELSGLLTKKMYERVNELGAGIGQAVEKNMREALTKKSGGLIDFIRERELENESANPWEKFLNRALPIFTGKTVVSEKSGFYKEVEATLEEYKGGKVPYTLILDALQGIETLSKIRIDPNMTDIEKEAAIKEFMDKRAIKREERFARVVGKGASDINNAIDGFLDMFGLTKQVKGLEKARANLAAKEPPTALLALDDYLFQNLGIIMKIDKTGTRTVKLKPGTNLAQIFQSAGNFKKRTENDPVTRIVAMLYKDKHIKKEEANLIMYGVADVEKSIKIQKEKFEFISPDYEFDPLKVKSIEVKVRINSTDEKQEFVILSSPSIISRKFKTFDQANTPDLKTKLADKGHKFIPCFNSNATGEIAQAIAFKNNKELFEWAKTNGYTNNKGELPKNSFKKVKLTSGTGTKYVYVVLIDKAGIQNTILESTPGYVPGTAVVGTPGSPGYTPATSGNLPASAPGFADKKAYQNKLNDVYKAYAQNAVGLAAMQGISF